MHTAVLMVIYWSTWLARHHSIKTHLCCVTWPFVFCWSEM